MPMLWQEPVKTQKRPVIAILDTGVDIDHPDLKANIWTNTKETDGADNYDDDGNGFEDDVHGWDFVNQTGRIGDWNGHGTHCAGIAAAVGGNGIGIVGANPDALIMPVTVMQSDGTGDVATIIKGIDYAVANGADIISMSFGSYGESKAEEQALGRAYQKAILVAAAGNDGKCLNHAHPERQQFAPMPMYPGAYTFVLGVQAMGGDGNVTSWSNYDDNGPTYSEWGEGKLYNYELLAPGATIESTYPGGKYKVLNGTSMATPMVAGAISRLIQTKEYPNKEYLYGDLINARTATGGLDIYKAFSIKDEDRKPEISFVTYELDDSKGVEGATKNDGDGKPDAGEAIDIYPTVRNSWGKAKNIKLSIELGENEDPTIVKIIKNEADFGSELSAYGKAKSKEALRIKINDKCADNRHIRLIIKGTCDGSDEVITQNVTLTVENGVEIGGVIKEDMTLYPNVHYIVTKNLAIPEGVTLTIKPGTKLEFKGTYFVNDGAIIAVGKPDSLIVLEGMDSPDDISGAKIYFSDNMEYVEIKNSNLYYLVGKLRNSIIKNNKIQFMSELTWDSQIYCNHIYYGHIYDNNFRSFISGSDVFYHGDFTSCNFTNNSNGYFGLNNLKKSNIWNNKRVSVGLGSKVFSTDAPNYFGSSKTSIVRKEIYDINNGYGTTEYDLSNMLTRPNAEAHGIVWKVVVDGYDAQDEFDMLPPLGVGKHKVEVYFNRPMRTSIAPMVAMGVRPPYTQTPIAEDGTWSKDSLVYTAYLTITGKSGFDGLNRIYVDQAKDNEGFDIPIENTRFNVNVQAAGSLSTGFMGEAGLGKVTLSWSDVQNSFDDFLGYNLYRYTSKGDTVKVNKQLLDSEVLDYVDYDVVPDTTYYYFYKVITTDLKETDPSNIVAVTPKTSTLGDANGSGMVDVADVIATVNYASGQSPKPFIYEAADVNKDSQIDILDVVGIIRIILHPNDQAQSLAMATATYTVEDGVVYVDSPVALAGVQIQLATEKGSSVTSTEDMKAFEQTSAWLSDNDYIYLAYSMSGKTLAPGKHAVLNIGNAKIMGVRLSDVAGTNVEARNSQATNITRLGSDAMTVSGIYTLTGVKVSGNSSDLKNLPTGVYIVDGKKVVK